MWYMCVYYMYVCMCMWICAQFKIAIGYHSFSDPNRPFWILVELYLNNFVDGQTPFKVFLALYYVLSIASFELYMCM